MSNKYCRDCVHFDIPDYSYPCNACSDHSLFMSKQVMLDDNTSEITEFICTEEPATIHKRPANVYEGIDAELLKRVRDIMMAYYDTNEEYIEESAKQQLLHDIDIINDIVGYSFIHLKKKLQYVLKCVEDLQIETNGSAMPEINADELEAIRTMVDNLGE